MYIQVVRNEFLFSAAAKASTLFMAIKSMRSQGSGDESLGCQEPPPAVRMKLLLEGRLEDLHALKEKE